MTENGQLPKQSRQAAIDALLAVDEDALIAELGGRASAMEFNRNLAGEEAMAPAPGFNPEGIGEDVLALGTRIFDRANREMYNIVCGDGLIGRDEKQAVLGALTKGDGVLAAAISSVLISTMGLAPVIATVAGALIVKKVFKNGADDLYCDRWATTIGVEQLVEATAPAAQIPPITYIAPAEFKKTIVDTPRHVSPDSQGRISLDELFSLVQDSNVPREDLRKYFKVDTARSSAFSPKIEVNTDRVLPMQLESAAAAGIANFFSKADRQNRYTQKIEKMDGNFLRFVSEGDSWFQYPILLDDVIDQLFDTYPIFSLGEAGDVLDNMVGWTGLDDVIAQKQAHGLLFSGGGNDLLGDGRLAAYVKPFDPDLLPVQYINDTFAVFLNSIQKNYRTLFDRLFMNFPNLRIFVHGYDYAVPRTDGKWLGRPMIEKGITDPALQRMIIKAVVDIHNTMMAKLANSYGDRVVLVDCRGVTNGKQDWYDELHPTSIGYAAAAKRFKRSIDAVFRVGG